MFVDVGVDSDFTYRTTTSSRMWCPVLLQCQSIGTSRDQMFSVHPGSSDLDSLMADVPNAMLKSSTSPLRSICRAALSVRAPRTGSCGSRLTRPGSG